MSDNRVFETGILVQLPNKDLWRGFDPNWEKNRKPPENVVDVTATPSDKATVTGTECMWCAMKFDTTDLLKDHVETLHFYTQNMKEATATKALEFLSAKKKA